jgi:ferritin
MLSKKMLKALNDQINAEYHSSYIYLSMSAWFEANNLPGFANWMRIQADEEMFHVMNF